VDVLRRRRRAPRRPRLVAERFRLPGLVGIVLGGTLVGPFVLDWVEREGVVESLGELGLLFLMFLAGMELDLDEFERDRKPALRFGALTFTLPFVLGLLLVLPFGYGLATAALYGSCGPRTRSSRTRSCRSTGSPSTGR
jgi:Kef-type K+ transport system membrane component KefB